MDCPRRPADPPFYRPDPKVLADLLVTLDECSRPAPGGGYKAPRILFDPARRPGSPEWNASLQHTCALAGAVERLGWGPVLVDLAAPGVFVLVPHEPE